VVNPHRKNKEIRNRFRKKEILCEKNLIFIRLPPNGIRNEKSMKFLDSGNIFFRKK